MKEIVYLGDAATAAAFAAAGIEAGAPAPGEELAAFQLARAESQLLLLGAGLAAALPPHALESALAGTAPLVSIIHAAEDRAGVPDAAARARRQLGLEP
jgi:hypothetical protein